ncbi:MULTISPECIES: hypothetical protein [unclassified Acidovorax]|uniref:hypothetical protein n=1 Tax=unclassified Acidovorax TaxID=2684926 RepID=UPI0011B1CB7E|nr:MULTISPECIES: hypothetical protein [unclassified Acidovorax]MDH4419059.1 hypothetical protein [Acidovorax sp.]
MLKFEEKLGSTACLSSAYSYQISSDLMDARRKVLSFRGWESTEECLGVLGWLQTVRLCSPGTAIAVTGHSSNQETTNRRTVKKTVT